MSRSTLAFLLLAVLFSASLPCRADSACEQARAIVAEVRAMYASGPVDHQRALHRLATARDLCSTLGDAWKYSYCAATALNDPKARIYKDRAIFNGVSDFECGGAAGARSPAPKPAPLPSYVREKFALVIGIGDFKDPQIPRLQFAAKDAEDLARVLQDPRYGRFKPENVILLTNAKATREKILNALQDLFLRVQEDDLVFMYVSSHGSQKQTDKGLMGIGYIVTYDTMVKNIWLESLDYQGFSQQTAVLKARRKVVFLDTCFSGQASMGSKGLSIEGVGVDRDTAQLFLSGEGTYVITSSKDNERSFESDSLKNSYFTYYLMEALKKGSEPPTVKEIFAYLAQRVPDAVAREKQSFQHPQMVPADGPGDVKVGVAPLSQAGAH
jgi:hypothetical protein